ncbi:type II toxin-antitoxin system RelE/ParE family toxin [Mesorhizobium sp. CA6]|uniref:type II toxin-antitoxin system RelE/ParE family toxin n=1 Tax=Mesorhizobium sp. CA6 TaxID=588500 RepID=UPI00296209B4|nr:type II toxin-antitoxin system RelE/ParE family toxin [Mesorhizobium sp. CA6]
MEYRIVFHPKAEAELEQLYDDIAERASPAIAWDFVVDIRDLCLGLSTFPQRGTERVETMPGCGSLGIVALSASFSLSTASAC